MYGVPIKETTSTQFQCPKCGASMGFPLGPPSEIPNCTGKGGKHSRVLMKELN